MSFIIFDIKTVILFKVMYVCDKIVVIESRNNVIDVIELYAHYPMLIIK